MGHSRNQREYQKTNDNEHTMTPNLWDAAKADLRGKFRTIQSTSRNKKNLKYQFKLTLKATRERQKYQSYYKKINHKGHIRLNEIQMKKVIAKINKNKSWFFEEINKIDKLLARLIKKIREKLQNKLRTEKREVTTDTTEI